MTVPLEEVLWHERLDWGKVARLQSRVQVRVRSRILSLDRALSHLAYVTAANKVGDNLKMFNIYWSHLYCQSFNGMMHPGATGKHEQIAIFLFINKLILSL